LPRRSAAILDGMDTTRTSRTDRSGTATGTGSASPDPRVVALVKLLARQAAEAEYERLLRTHLSAPQPARSDRPPPEESAP